MERTKKIDLGESHYAGMIALLTLSESMIGEPTECYYCGGPIRGDFAHCYQWVHRVLDDPTVSNLLLFCSAKCLIEHLKKDSTEELGDV